MRTLTIAFKDLLQIVRDWKSALFLVIMPILFTAFFAFVLDPVYRRDAEQDPRLPVGWYAAGGDSAGSAGDSASAGLQLAEAFRTLAEDSPAIRLESVDAEALDALDDLAPRTDDRADAREADDYQDGSYDAGHDGIQLAIGQVFERESDHLFPYYRDMLTAHSAGLTAEELILNGISKDADVAGGGRHMSNHFAKVF